MISKEERAELRELVASVTPPLPWKSDSDGVIVSDLYEFVADCDGTGGDFIDPKPAKLIAGAVNAAPKLLDALDAADERIAELEARLETGPFGDDKVDELADAVSMLRARIAELEATAQWRPIEEAPKSEVLLVAAPGTCVLRAYWSEGEWRESRVYEPLYFTPTHFRSLPAAPIPALPEGAK